ncbi:hypothetical protein K1391_004619, partial [Escherichia coli]|nr:hypothetical protein [Escherichia coli]
TNRPLTDFGGKTSIFSHPVYLFLREFSLQDFRGGSEITPTEFTKMVVDDLRRQEKSGELKMTQEELRTSLLAALDGN